MAISDWWGRSSLGVPVARDVFIETGCKAGDTLWEAKDRFPACHSIEINAEAHARCVERFRPFPNVRIHLGDSRAVLPGIIDPSLATTFYLDAHCEGSPSRVPEADTECPLIEEVRVIVTTPWRTNPIVIIDDINMLKAGYWSDPGSNHHLFTPGDWPRFEEIAALLADYRYVEDVNNRVGLWA